MKNYLKGFTNYIPLILLVFYCLGYFKMIGYYSVYDIDIEYYLNINDFIFVAVKGVIKLLFIYLAIEFLTIVIISFLQIIYYRFISQETWNVAVIKGEKQKFEENLGRRAVQEAVFITFITLIIWMFFFNWYKAGFVYLGMTAVFQMARVVFMDSKSLKFRKLMYGLIFIFSLLGGFYLWGKIEGIDIQNKLRSWGKEVKFQYEDKEFSSLSEYQILLGETTGYIFIYDLEKKSSSVISKESVQGLQIIQKIND